MSNKRPMTIALHSIRCLTETDEGGSAADEPYVLVFALNLQGIPQAHVEMYGPWGNTDEGEVKKVILKSSVPQQLLANFPTWRWPGPFWGIGGKSAALPFPTDAIFLVQVMENDDATAGGVRSAVQAQMVAAALGMAKSGLTREQLVEQLRISMGDACDAARAIGVPNADDRVGSAHEFKLGLADLVRVQKGDTVQTTMEISGDGGKYRLRFEAKPA